MSEADAVDVSSLSQDLTYSDSPSCMETINTASGVPQNEININGENESKTTLSEDIFNTLDNLIGDANIENYSQNVVLQIDTRISSLKQFEPICKFHRIEAFNDEMITFQSAMEGLPYTEKPELQSHMCNYDKDSNINKDLYEEENPGGMSISTNKDLLANEFVSEPSRSLPLMHCCGEKLSFMEKSQAQSTAKEPAPNFIRHQNFLHEEIFYSDAEEPFDKEDSFNLLDLRANYQTETAVAPNEIQNYGETPEAICYQNEVRVGDEESTEIFSTWSPGDISWSGGGSNAYLKTFDPEQRFESLQPLAEDTALNEVIGKLKHINKQQQTRIQDLQCRNTYLEMKVKELQMNITRKQVLSDIFNKLQEHIEKLIEDKYKVILEKSDSDRTLKNVQAILSNTQKHLQKSRKENTTLQQELKKIKVNYVHLQERYRTEIQQKNKYISQCIEMDKTLNKKEEETERLQQVKAGLETTTASTLDLLKREKETRGQELLSLQEEFQKHEKQNLQERQKLKSRIDTLIAQVKKLQFISENERAKNIKLQQQIYEVKTENAKLQQQVTKCKEQNYIPKLEIIELKEQSEEVMEPYITKDLKMIHPNLFLNCSPCEEESLSSPDEEKTQLAPKIHNLLTLMVGLLTCQDITHPGTEHFKDSEKISEIMLQRLKSFYIKKKNLHKELLKHTARITMIRELIASEKSFQDQVIEAADFDSNEAKNVDDIPTLLGAKLDKYHNLNEELDFMIAKLGNLLESKEDHCNRLIEENDKYHRHVGTLINKVTSYEEIIKCADQRLEISHSQIAHLEERNKHLEDLIRRPRERTTKLRPRRLENHPKSMTMPSPSRFSNSRPFIKDFVSKPKSLLPKMMKTDMDAADAANQGELEENTRLINQVLELLHTLEDLSARVDAVKEENLKLKSENQVLGHYIVSI